MTKPPQKANHSAVQVMQTYAACQQIRPARRTQEGRRRADDPTTAS